MIHFITGGERSGKSSYAQKTVLSLSKKPKYIATSKVWDGDHAKRIARHKSDRDERWTNIEEEKYIAKHISEGDTVIIDCVTLWLTNFFTDSNGDIESSLEEAKSEFDLFKDKNAQIFIISNEIGMGVHAQTEVGRNFTQLQGWMNQYIAKNSEKATFMVSGIPLTLK